MSLLRTIAVVFRKELVDGRRDRRSLVALAFSAVVMPLLFGVMFMVTAERRRNADDIALPVAGAEFAPLFVDWLQQQSGVRVVPAPADPERAVRERDEDVVLVIDRDFDQAMAKAMPASVRLLADLTRDASRPKVSRVRSLVASYSQTIGGLRLVARGVAPSVALAIRLEEVDISSAQQRLATLLGMLPLLLVMAGLTGGMQIAIDSTAGERERGSLEPLLLSPVPRAGLAAGKWMAASVFGCAAVLFSLVLTMSVMRRVPWHDLGMRFAVTDVELASLLGLMLPLALLLSAVVMFASTFARSFKEAQSYLGMLMLLPMLPGLVSVVFPLSNRPWLAPVPIIGQYALAADVLGGKPPPPILYLAAGVTTVLVAAAFVVGTARLLGRESIIFGR